MTHRSLRGVGTLLLPILLAGCGADVTAPSNNPLPVLQDVTPRVIPVGVASATLSITGAQFESLSQVRVGKADRPTHYVDETHLTVDLTPSDLATPASLSISVVNGGPGGGQSSAIAVTVENPVPTVTAASPLSVTWLTDATQRSFQLEVDGTNFVAGTYVTFNGSSLAPQSMTATHLTVTVSGYMIAGPGLPPVAVVTPGPGGGTIPLSFSVNYPLPTLAGVTPDSALTGPGVTLTLKGTGFSRQSSVLWNGNARTTTFVNTQALQVVIPATDLATDATANLTVTNPTPGGGASSPLPFRVREAAPVIYGISPARVVAGSGPATITITGNNLRAGATVQWNGATRPSTLVNSTSMTVTLDSADLVTAAALPITVTNPGASGVSNAIRLTVTPPTLGLAITGEIFLAQRGLVADPVRDLLYASVPLDENTPVYGNTVVRIDPVSGAITGSVPIGGDPGPMAVSDDGQFLYVGRTQDPIVTRINLATFTRDLEITVPHDPWAYSNEVTDIVVLPGHPHTFVVSARNPNVSPNAYVMDDTVARPVAASGVGSLSRGPTAGLVFGTTASGLLRLRVEYDGLYADGSLAVSGAGIEYDAGFIYTSGGDVIDAYRIQKIGTAPQQYGGMRPDAANGRVHSLWNGVLSTYQYADLTPLATFTDIELQARSSLVRWGRDGLAAGGNGAIVIMRGSQVAP